MKIRGFTLLELLITIGIIAVLIGAAIPYYLSYIADAKLSKAKHELDILKEALIKFDTFEDKKFTGTDLTILLGRYLQTLPSDPWGRPYEVDSIKGIVKSQGPDSSFPRDDITVEYYPPLALQRASWVDNDNSSHISPDDFIRLDFSRIVQGNKGPLRYGVNPAVIGDLLFSPEVKTADLVATLTSSSTFLLIPIGLTGNESTFSLGSSTVRVASLNEFLLDTLNRKANGSTGQFSALEVTIKEK